MVPDRAPQADRHGRSIVVCGRAAL
jgi:hypothetical protein